MPAQGPWPQDDPSSFDKITIGARRWPGIATVKPKRGRKIDRKAANGQQSERLTFKGIKAADIEIHIVVDDPAEYDDLWDAVAEIEPEFGKKDPKPLDVGHPICAMRKISQIAIAEIDGPEWHSKEGQFEVKITAIEFRPPPPGDATSTPESGSAYGFGTASYGNNDPKKGGPLFAGGKNASTPYTPPDDDGP